MPTLKLHLLGPPRVELDDTPVDLQRRKALALLVYLAINNQPHSRDTLATLFWPDHTQSQARAYLRRDLAVLNTSPAGRWLEADRETIELKHKPGFWLDVAEFSRLLETSQSHNHGPELVCQDCLRLLSDAVTLYNDDFLAGFTLRDSREFDDWQFFQTESLRQELGGALARLVQGYSKHGQADEAIPLARRWVALDPLYEPAQRQLITLYDAAGQPAAAIRQYEEYVKFLEEELGLPPEEDMTTLYEAIKAKRILGSYLKTQDRSRAPLKNKPWPDKEPEPEPELSPDDRPTRLDLAAELAQEGQYSAAIEQLKPLLKHNPVDEHTHRLMMRFYALGGHHHEALRQYQTCIQALATRDMAPDTETEQLYHQIINGDLAFPFKPAPKPPWLPSVPIAVEVEPTIPLVGRADELATLKAKIEVGWQGRGCTLLLCGDSGVGKTRIAYELLQSAAAGQMITMVGAAYEQEGYLPYQPFIEAFDRYLAEQQRPVDHNPITHYQPLESNDPQQERTALFKAAATFLTSLAASVPVVLLIDDLHAADEASLSLFHYMARHTRSAPVILLATYRTDAGANALSPVGSLLNALYRERLSDMLHLRPLSEPGGAAIIGHTLQGEVEPAVVKTVFEMAEGNPFFIQEISRAMLKSGRLLQESGQWRLAPGPTMQVPAQLRDLLRERVQRLGAAVEAALATAAVIGREFRFTILSAVASLPDGELLDALDAALSTHLVEETEEGYRFCHPLLRQVLYDGLSRVRRVWLHGRVAEAIEAAYGQHPAGLEAQVEALAYHYDRSDQRNRAMSYLVQAGKKAAAVYALEVASEHYERALALMNEAGIEDAPLRWQILQELGSLTFILGDTRRTVEHLEEALAMTPTPDWQPGLEDWVQAHRLIAKTLITAGHTAMAEQHLQVAMEAATDLGQASHDYSDLLYDVALWHLHRNEYQDALEVARRSLYIAEQLGNNEAKARAYEAIALACHARGDWEQGLAFEKQRAALVGSNLDVTRAYDLHL